MVLTHLFEVGNRKHKMTQQRMGVDPATSVDRWAHKLHSIGSEILRKQKRNENIICITLYELLLYIYCFIFIFLYISINYHKLFAYYIYI